MDAEDGEVVVTVSLVVGVVGVGIGLALAGSSPLRIFLFGALGSNW